jgi:LysR family glycine cleavage system transcriptional activator
MNLANRRSSLRGLRTFCTAARYQSFRLAAEELHVTASAVSHQIKSLEEELNVQLFERRSRTLELTPEGVQMYAELSPVMDQLDLITARFRAPHLGRQLRISAQPFFASELFLPKLQEFTALNPGIEIYVDTSDESSEKHPAMIDASIRLFRNTPTNLQSDPLFPLRLVPACSPAFLKRYQNDSGGFSESFPVVLHANRPSAWNNWMKSAGIDLPEPSQTIKVDSMIGVARAAERGLGAALVPMPLSENWFKSGALVQMFDHEIVLEDHFYFVSDKSQAEQPDVQALRSWVLEKFVCKS